MKKRKLPFITLLFRIRLELSRLVLMRTSVCSHKNVQRSQKSFYGSVTIIKERQNNKQLLVRQFVYINISNTHIIE